MHAEDVELRGICHGVMSCSSPSCWPSPVARPFPSAARASKRRRHPAPVPPACAKRPGRQTASASPRAGSTRSGRWRRTARTAKRVVTSPTDFTVERDPAWSPDGQSIAFSAEQKGEFDIWIAPARGGTARRVTSMSGDERWPSWTHDNRIVFSHRAPKGAWQLFVVAADGSGATPRSSRRTTPKSGRAASRPTASSSRTCRAATRSRQRVGHLGARAVRGGRGRIEPALRARDAPRRHGSPSGLGARQRAHRVRDDARQPERGVGDRGALARRAGRPRGGAGRGRGGAPQDGGDAGAASTVADTPVLASRHPGVPAWSPDGQTLLIATFPTTVAGYNGNPDRNDADPPMAFAAAADSTRCGAWPRRGRSTSPRRRFSCPRRPRRDGRPASTRSGRR